MDMFQKEVTQKIEEEWKGKLVQLREEMDSERRRELEDKHNLWEKQKEEEIKELQERLDQDHKSEVESLRSRFRLAISTTTMERSPSDSSLEKSQVQKDVVELSKHEEAIANLQQHFEVEKKQLVAQARETEKQIWETKLQSTVEKLANKYENQMAEFTAKLSREHQDHCENLKSRVHAEKQVTFNQAVEQVSREKGFIVESLQKEKEELVIQLQQEKERLESIIEERVDVSSDNGRLLKEALEKEKLAW
ncbi:calponin homology domain-containing protein DDB_G0272472-like [Limulus polyphemus]|uniref:Calponin homology domain-containing protein DDB_G0272472-like n=1 Tax=Limulus polyphemus TaxID=6850 RepID=A0ABM1C3C0_LIMPO|nr:calponin homology domain-containing protein DDB_G0272472-like [Limulus polyphemus]